MTTWIPFTEPDAIIGTYEGYDVLLSDLAPETEKFDNFPLSNSNNKVCMPLENGVSLLYNLFIKDYKDVIMRNTKKGEMDCFGMFSVNIVPHNFMVGDKRMFWNKYFWQQETIKLFS